MHPQNAFKGDHSTYCMLIDRCISKPKGELDKVEKNCLAKCMDRFSDTVAIVSKAVNRVIFIIIVY